MNRPSDDDQRTAALMMAAGGLKPVDIARHLGLHEQQVREWLNVGRREPDPATATGGNEDGR